MEIQYGWIPYIVWIISLVVLISGRVQGSEFINYGVATEVDKPDLTKHPGHLKPFGTGIVHNLEELLQVSDPETFYNRYVLPSKPVKFKGAVKNNPAFTKWTDDYFLNLVIPNPYNIEVEYHKKEIRGLEPKRIDFKKFVKTHNKSSLYMIDAVPDFLRSDLIIPYFLQCPFMMNKAIDEAVMWFSGGGTSSVVHTDDYHNINCVFRGTKELIFIDTDKYGHLAAIDRPNGSYSSLDVDSVDFTKYPGYAKVEYIKTHLEPGDCVYIPYRWIHQVRSFNSNIAINIWWDYRNENVELDQCNKQFDESLTFYSLPDNNKDKLKMLQGRISSIFASAKDFTLSCEEFIHQLIPDIQAYEGEDFFKMEVDALIQIADEIIGILDTDRDGYISMDEIMNNSESVAKLEPHAAPIFELFDRIDAKLKGEDPTNHEEL